MHALHKQFANNKSLESEKGVPINYEEFSVTILRAGGTNTNFGRVAAEKLKTCGGGRVSDEAALRMLAETFAETVIVGWDLKDKDDKAVPFTQEAVVDALIKYPDFFDDIQKKAMDLDLFKASREEVIAKN